jgi:hypothetical protein
MKFLPLIAVLLASCAPSSPVMRASESKSFFNPPPQVMSHNYPEQDVYRVYQRGGSGFVPVNAVRNAAEERAMQFAERQGKGMVLLGEKTGGSFPSAPGSFPRCEIIFAVVNKQP